MYCGLCPAIRGATMNPWPETPWQKVQLRIWSSSSASSGPAEASRIAKAIMFEPKRFMIELSRGMLSLMSGHFQEGGAYLSVLT